MGFLRRLLGGGSQEEKLDGSTLSLPDSPTPVGRTRAFDGVEKAQAAFARGDNREAERWFRRAVDEYRAVGDHWGTAFALGRLGNFYQGTNRIPEAVKTYESAVRMGNDIPAIYTGLMTAYADTRDEDALFRTADVFSRNLPKQTETIPDLLIHHAKRQLKAGDADIAERWLLRTEGWAIRSGNTAARFAAWGQRGLTAEKSGDLERAVAIYEAAVAAGSTDRVTYTRLLMAYEKGKRWDELLGLARRVLGIQREAAWEEDLRKRIARAESRQSPAAAKQTKVTIPSFSVRHGADRLELTGQLTVKRGASRIAVTHDGRMLIVSAGSSKPENLSLIDLSTNQTVWTTSVPGASAEVLALDSGLFLVASEVGKVGEGRSELTFLQPTGQSVADSILPDRLSEVRTANGLVVAGCRDGHLYAFDTNGRQLWRYLVPSRDDLPSNQPSS